MEELQGGRGKLGGAGYVDGGDNFTRVQHTSKLCALNMHSLSHVKYTSVKLFKNVCSGHTK